MNNVSKTIPFLKTPKWIIDESYECLDCGDMVTKTRTVNNEYFYEAVCECLQDKGNKDES